MKKRAAMVGGRPEVDTGWAFAVLFGSGLAQAVFALIYSVGIFNMIFLEEFGESKQTTAWMGAVQVSMQCLLGPLSGLMNKHLGPRVTVMIGGLLNSAGFALTYFATSFGFLFFSFGIIVGLGIGISYVPVVVIIGSYFKKYRNLAYGVMAATVGIGCMVLPPVIIQANEAYGWRGCMLIMSGIALQHVLCGALFRPQDLPTEVEDYEDNRSLTKEDTIVVDENYTEKEKLSKDLITSDDSSFRKDHYKLSNITTMEQTMPVRIDKGNMSALRETDKHDVVRSSHFTIQELAASHEPMTVSTASLALTFTENKHVARFRQRTASPLSTSLDAIHVHIHPKSDLRIYSKSQEHIALDHSHGLGSDEGTRNGSNHNNISTTVTQPRIKTKCSVLRNSKLLLLFINLLCVNGGSFIGYLHFPAYFQLQGATESELSFLMTLVGVASIVSRILVGLTSNDKDMSVLLLYFSTGGIAAVVFLLCPLLSQTPAGRIVFAVGFGVFNNTYCALNPPLTLELCNLSELNTAFSISCFMMGVSALISPPLAGWLYDISLDYRISFYYAGVQYMIGSLLLMLIPIIKNRESVV